jgi:hypothetical protein
MSALINEFPYNARSEEPPCTTIAFADTEYLRVVRRNKTKKRDREKREEGRGTSRRACVCWNGVQERAKSWFDSPCQPSSLAVCACSVVDWVWEMWEVGGGLWHCEILWRGVEGCGWEVGEDRWMKGEHMRGKIELPDIQYWGRSVG